MVEKNTVLVTGSGGLIGSCLSNYYLSKGYKVIGVDNNMRKKMFGSGGDVDPVIFELEKNKNYHHSGIDIRDDLSVDTLIKYSSKELYCIHHLAAAPSHDWSATNAKWDFEINARGTLNVLEASRKFCPNVPITVMSTNKVYGDGVNRLSLEELEKKYEIQWSEMWNGINEEFPVQQELHSLFGVSKLYADFVAKEYGKNFGLPVGIFRGGCLTGKGHRGVQLHGFLAYIVKCAVHNIPYQIFGYKGKQVRDQISSYDVCTALDTFVQNPSFGEVYNLGGGRANSASVLEIIDLLLKKGYELNYEYIDKARTGDHMWYITDMAKFRAHFPNWEKKYSLDSILDEIIEYELQTLE